MPSDQVMFYLLCAVAVILSVASSLSRDESIRVQVSRSLINSGAIFGLLTTFILFTRSYYSRAAILLSFVFAAIACVAAIILKERSRPQRVAVLGPVGDLSYVPNSVRMDASEDLPDHTGLIVVSPGRGAAPDEAAALAAAAVAGVRIRSLPEYVEESQGRVVVEDFDIADLPHSSELELYSAYKRTMDLIICFMVLPFIVPIVFVSSIGIAMTMGSPVLFTQPRVGLGGKVFLIYKLRTMKMGDARREQIATAVSDPRITPLGSFMRRFRIDELPQIFNIIRGEMSLIGPRPEQPQLSELYKREVPGFAYRTLVRPGLSGWAQVNSGYADDINSTKSKISYDLFYIKNFSLSMDLRIAYRTITTIIFGSGVR